MTQRIALVLAVWLASSLAPVQAQAPAGPWDLQVDAPAGAACVATPALSRMVMQRTGHAASVPADGARVRVHIDSAPPGSGWSAVVSSEDEAGRVTGTRTVQVDAADCRALDPFLVLVIAAILGIEGAPAAPEPVPPQPPAIASEPASSRVATVASPAEEQTAHTPSAPWHLGAGLGGLLQTGLPPSAAWGPALALRMEHGAFVLVAAANWLPARSSSIGNGGMAHFELLLGVLDSCAVVLNRPAAEVDLCAGLQAGTAWARSSGLWRVAASSDFVVHARPSARGLLRVGGPFWLELLFGFAIALNYPDYSYRDRAGVERAYHPGTTGVLTQLGMLWRPGS